MFDVHDLLDRAKAASGVSSDYALAVKVMGYAKASTVTNWRSGRSLPDDDAILKLCGLTGDDPAVVAATIRAERAQSDEAAALWRQIAERLASPATAKIAVLFAAVLVAQFFGGLDASALPLLAGFAFENVYIVSICLLVALFATRPGWRLLTLVYRAARTYKA